MLCRSGKFASSSDNVSDMSPNDGIKTCQFNLTSLLLYSSYLRLSETGYSTLTLSLHFFHIDLFTYRSEAFQIITMSDFTELNRQYFRSVHDQYRVQSAFLTNPHSKLASSYREEFRQGQELIFNEVQGRRAWISDTWNDTKSGKGHKIRMLEYACGPGAVSAVCISNRLLR